MDPANASDVYALVALIIRIDAGLRLVALHPGHYVPNGHFDRIAPLLTKVQAEVTDWLDSHTEPAAAPRGRRVARRPVDRRQRAERREAPDSNAD
jgi:hypothetical protein